MAYCTTTDLIARISQTVLISLTDDERLATSATTLAAAIVLNSDITARITAAIVDADCEIDSYLRKQYSVPLTSPPARVVRCSCSLAMYFLHCRRRSEMGLPDDVRQIFADEQDWLKGVNKGALALGIDPPPAASTAVISTADGEDRAFTADTLEDF